MKKIKFKKLNFNELNEITDGLISKLDLTWYLSGGREDILQYPDIFYKNSRSKKQIYTRFDLFEETDDCDFLLCPFYLELFEFYNIGQLIPKFIEILAKKYSNKILLFSWNHDNDFSKYHIPLMDIDNYKIINFGYIKQPTKKDILVPFWNVDTNYVNIDKIYFSSFIGSINNISRQTLVENIKKYNNSDLLYFENKNFAEYKKILSLSKFSLCPLGGPNDGGFSYRFFETLHSGSVPVLIANNINFPYKDLDWNLICLHLDISFVDKMEQLLDCMKTFDHKTSINYIFQNKEKFTIGGVQEEIFKSLITI